MIDNIVINFLFSGNFENIKDIRKKCNSIIDLSKFTSTKKILNWVVAVDYNQIYTQIFFYNKPYL